MKGGLPVSLQSCADDAQRDSSLLLDRFQERRRRLRRQEGIHAGREPGADGQDALAVPVVVDVDGGRIVTRIL